MYVHIFVQRRVWDQFSMYGPSNLVFTKPLWIMAVSISVGDEHAKWLILDMDIENIMSWQDRYQPMDLYFKTRVWIAHHLPEIVYELLYIGHAKR